LELAKRDNSFASFTSLKGIEASQPSRLTIVQRCGLGDYLKGDRRVVLALNLPSPSVKASPLLPFDGLQSSRLEIHTD